MHCALIRSNVVFNVVSSLRNPYCVSVVAAVVVVLYSIAISLFSKEMAGTLHAVYLCVFFFFFFFLYFVYAYRRF